MELRSLLAAAGKGDQAAWDAIVNEFSSLLWSIARSFRLDQRDASDVVQITWLRLVENVDHIKEPEALPAWLAVTVRRECMQLLRRTSRQQLVRHAEPVDDMPDTAPPVDHAMLTTERDIALWRRVAALGETCFRLLRVLMASPPPSYREAAAALDMPIGSLGPTRQRCLQKLRESMDTDGQRGDRG
ncbi:RNA polymerase sigma factor [Actinophytocola oryzae]|uniref:RNA polymerase sigma factor (Sigma-70 family) n=1 Tax=Actinophytocola oryzae TaxID=502181 RepID=A0A4V3FV32_9PSEU|nr:sigma-70 family RNA polymerase sigma factor [Actinophytocola oryzae]TDV57491.1 RNA polymerase sigma factor (sigma-70 family) [Actinophytocola oryzae]